MTSIPRSTKQLAYLTSQYPATSHTFISREIIAIRQLGLELDTFSIRPPYASEIRDRLLAREAKETFTVLGQPATSFVAANIKTILANPLGYARALRQALSHRPPGLKGFALSIAHFIEAILLAGELKRRRISRLHNHFANSAATVGYLAASLLRLPWSFTIHGISETDYPAGLLLGRKIEAATFVACASYFVRAQAMRLVAPEHWHKLHVVRCGLPVQALRFHLKNGAVKRFICVGRLSAEKGQVGLLWAFAEIAHAHPEIELVFVGDGPLSGALHKRAEKLGLGERIRFLGRLGEAETLAEIANSDVLVLSSFMEGLPVVLMEAMALGTAVIASRVAGVPELVRDGINGLLYTPANWTELVCCMRRLIESDNLRLLLTESARSDVADGFDIARSAEQLRDLFENDEQYADLCGL